MPPELHLHPDALRAHAAVVAGLVDELRAADAAPAPDAAEVDRLRAAVHRSAHRLTELRAALTAATVAAERVDSHVAACLPDRPDRR